MSVGRNDPCPCGSGKKYKKCCLPRDEAGDGAPAAPVAIVDQPAGFLSTMPAWKVGVLLGAICLALGSAVGLWRDIESGLAVFGAASLGSVIVMILRRPPASSGKPTDRHAGVGFGRERKQPKRPRNRKERRSDS